MIQAEANAISGMVILGLAGVYLFWHMSRVQAAERRAHQKGFERGKRAGHEEAFVEVWQSLTVSGRLSVPGPKGTPYEGSNIEIQRNAMMPPLLGAHPVFDRSKLS